MPNILDGLGLEGFDQISEGWIFGQKVVDRVLFKVTHIGIFAIVSLWDGKP